MWERRPESKRGRSLILLLSIVTLLIGLCYIAFVASGMPSNGTGGALVISQTSTLVQQPSTVTPSCPDAKTFKSGNAPSLDFCSPIYHGDVSGPYGSHITLVGENFSADGATWYVTANPKGIDNTGKITDENALKNYVQGTCQAQPTKDCYPVSPQDTGQLDNQTPQQKASLFYWTWSKDNSFPIVPADYYFLAVTGSGSKLTVIPSSVTFTLTTKDAPCITVSYKPSGSKSATNSSCNQTSPFSLSPGSTITVNGSNWLMQAPQADGGQLPAIKVNITADCTSCDPSHPESAHIDLGSATPDKNGNFSNVKKALPNGVKGTYNVSATTNATPVTKPYTDPNTSGNTIVNDAVTFGNANAGDTSLLTLQIGQLLPVPPSATATLTVTVTATATLVPTPRKTPTPCTNSCVTDNGKMLDTFSLVAWVPALLAGVLLIIVFVRRRLMNGGFTRGSTPPSTPSDGGNGRSSPSTPIRNEKSNRR